MTKPIKWKIGAGKLKSPPFQEGDRVYYVSGRHGKYGNNPLRGSEFECEGTVANRNTLDGLDIRVNWDNGTSNSYSFDDLRLVSDFHPALHANNPNAAFQRSKNAKRPSKLIKRCKRCGERNSVSNYNCRACGSTGEWIRDKMRV